MAARSVQQEIGILDAFGDALVGLLLAKIGTGQDARLLVGGNVGIYRLQGVPISKLAGRAALDALSESRALRDHNTGKSQD